MKLLSRLGFLACLICLQSCGDSMIKHKDTDTGKPGKDAHIKILVPDATDNLIIKDKKDIIGYWTGNFYSAFEGKVNIIINEINDKNVNGYTMIAGVFKPFASGIEKDGTTYNFVAERPGKGKYNGKLNISIAEGDSILKCTWLPFGSKTMQESIHGFSKKLFRYNANNKLDKGRFVDYKREKDVIYHDEAEGDVDAVGYLMTTPDANKYNASVDLLTKDEVANMKKPDILVLRNSIFARHGYAFKKEALWTYFSDQDWYVPISTDVTAELTPTEKKNLELLKQYEKNAKDYYETFGR
jgi:hypothetical protein